MIYTSPDSGNQYFPSLLRKDAQSEESDEIESVSSDLYDSCNSSNSGDSEGKINFLLLDLNYCI